MVPGEVDGCRERTQRWKEGERAEEKRKHCLLRVWSLTRLYLRRFNDLILLDQIRERHSCVVSLVFMALRCAMELYCICTIDVRLDTRSISPRMTLIFFPSNLTVTDTVFANRELISRRLLSSWKKSPR